VSGGLHIARGLTLDPDYVGGGTFALLAKKGAGKTYTGRVLAEEFWEAQVPFVAARPDGRLVGPPRVRRRQGRRDPRRDLRRRARRRAARAHRRQADGRPGRRRGPLRWSSDSPCSAPAPPSGSSRWTPSSSGSTAATSHLVHLLIDEADLFAPQKPPKGDEPLLGVTENIVRRGRNRGIGVHADHPAAGRAQQGRPHAGRRARAMRMLGPPGPRRDRRLGRRARRRPRGSRRHQGQPADLENGESLVVGPRARRPEARQDARVAHVRLVTDAEAQRAGRKPPKSFAEIDMGAIEEKMAATIERAKADDPKELRAQVRKLELTKAEARAGARRAESRARRGRDPRRGPGVAGRAAERGRAREAIEERGETIVSAAQDARLALRTRSSRSRSCPSGPGRAPGRPRRRPARPRPTLPSERRAQLRPARPAPAAASANGDGPRGVGPAAADPRRARPARGDRRHPADKTQLALFAQASPKSSSYTNNLGTLRTEG
jgi:hypothetical protein